MSKIFDMDTRIGAEFVSGHKSRAALKITKVGDFAIINGEKWKRVRKQKDGSVLVLVK